MGEMLLQVLPSPGQRLGDETGRHGYKIQALPLVSKARTFVPAIFSPSNAFSQILPGSLPNFLQMSVQSLSYQIKLPDSPSKTSGSSRTLSYPQLPLLPLNSPYQACAVPSSFLLPCVIMSDRHYWGFSDY